MKQTILALPIMVIVSGCVTDTRYTLYRTTVNLATKTEIASKRVYVATFDVPRSEFDDHFLSNYNKANCKFAEKLFNAEQPHFKGSIYEDIKIGYWCEEGGYKP